MREPIKPIKRDWLKKLRKEKKLNTREAAEIFGVSSTHLNDIENGRRNPSVDLSYEMANYYGVSVEKFLAERTKFTRSED